MNIGIIGCGNVSSTYFNSHKIFNNYKIISCADKNFDIAKKSAEEFGILAQSVEDILLNPDIELILNLTIPNAHKEIIIKTLKSGKHSFSEKPLAISFEEGKEIFEIALEKNLFVGCAPDTFLGSVGQKTREIIDSKKIGSIVLGTFNLMSHGMEHWHPNPDFFFKNGAGPIFDLGVYYITFLVNLLGSVKKIISVEDIVSKERIITSMPRNGEKIKVETPTTLMGILEFSNNVKVQFFASWDVWKHEHRNIELYGSNGSIIIPDPNFFGGKILVSLKDSEWEEINTENMLLGIPNMKSENTMLANYRGVGLSDMINNISKGKKPRCSIDLSLHVLEIMEGILFSSKNSNIYLMNTSCDKPDPLSEKEIKLLKI